MNDQQTHQETIQVQTKGVNPQTKTASNGNTYQICWIKATNGHRYSGPDWLFENWNAVTAGVYLSVDYTKKMGTTRQGQPIEYRNLRKVELYRTEEVGPAPWSNMEPAPPPPTNEEYWQSMENANQEAPAPQSAALGGGPPNADPKPHRLSAVLAQAVDAVKPMVDRVCKEELATAVGLFEATFGKGTATGQPTAVVALANLLVDARLRCGISLNIQHSREKSYGG